VFAVASSACEAGSSVQAAQTAITTAQTVLPGAQATAAAGATLVSGVLATAQPALTTVQAMLAGASVHVTTTPEGTTDPNSITDVKIDATDAQGTLAQVDPHARQAAALAALAAAGQYYPNARIELTITDMSGATLVTGSVAPGQTPSVQ
jgi:hypothetical protein